MAATLSEQATENLPVVLSAPLKLQYFIQIHNKLPLCASVAKSIFGIGKNDVLSCGQLVYMYCLKETKVVNIVDSSMRHLALPINTSVACTLLYRGQPTSSTSLDHPQDSSSVDFDSPSKLLNAQIRPKVVAVYKCGSSTKFRVKEILVLCEFSEEYFICYSVLEKIQKYVYFDADSQIGFTTDASMVQMELKDVVDHVPLPIKGLLHFEDKRLQQSFNMNKCELKSIGVKKSVLASFKLPPDTDDILNNLVEIYTCAPISLQVVKVIEEKDSQLLLQHTHNILNRFSPFSIDDIIIDVAAACPALQERLYHSSLTTQENWRTGVKVYALDIDNKTLPPPLTADSSLFTEMEKELPLSSHQHDPLNLSQNPSYDVPHGPSSFDVTKDSSSINNTLKRVTQIQINSANKEDTEKVNKVPTSTMMQEQAKPPVKKKSISYKEKSQFETAQNTEFPQLVSQDNSKCCNLISTADSIATKKPVQHHVPKLPKKPPRQCPHIYDSINETAVEEETTQINSTNTFKPSPQVNMDNKNISGPLTTAEDDVLTTKRKISKPPPVKKKPHIYDTIDDSALLPDKLAVQTNSNSSISEEQIISVSQLPLHQEPHLPQQPHLPAQNPSLVSEVKVFENLKPKDIQNDCTMQSTRVVGSQIDSITAVQQQPTKKDVEPLQKNSKATAVVQEYIPPIMDAINSQQPHLISHGILSAPLPEIQHSSNVIESIPTKTQGQGNVHVEDKDPASIKVLVLPVASSTPSRAVPSPEKLAVVTHSDQENNQSNETQSVSKQKNLKMKENIDILRNVPSSTNETEQPAEQETKKPKPSFSKKLKAKPQQDSLPAPLSVKTSESSVTNIKEVDDINAFQQTLISRIDELTQEVKLLKTAVLNFDIDLIEEDSYVIMDIESTKKQHQMTNKQKEEDVPQNSGSAAILSILHHSTDGEVATVPPAPSHYPSGQHCNSSTSIIPDISLLTMNEVQTLLEVNNLKQYKKKFAEEFIDGSILVQLDDEILKNDLKVEVKLHRLRLLKIIGSKSS